MPYKYIVHVSNDNTNCGAHINFKSYFYSLEDAHKFYNYEVDKAVSECNGNQVCMYRLVMFDRTFL